MTRPADLHQRALGCAETPFASFYRREGEAQLAQSACAAATIRIGEDDEALLADVERGVSAVFQRYEALRYGIVVDDTGGYWFRPVHADAEGARAACYRRASVTSEEAAWALFEREAARGTPDFEHALCRITAVRIAGAQRMLLLVNAHHALADGFVLDRLLGEVLCAAVGQLPPPEPVPLAPPIERHFERELTRWSFLRLVVRMTWRALGRGRALLSLSESRGVEWSERQSIYARRQLDADVCQRLRMRAREYGTTLHGAVAAAQILATQELAASAGVSLEGRVLKVAHAVDLRRRLKRAAQERDDDLRCAASGVNTYYRADSDWSFWALASQVKRDLDAEILGHRTPWRVLRAMREAPDLFALADAPFWGRSETVGISNIGPLAATDRACARGLDVEAVYIAGANHVVGALVSSIFTTVQGALCASFMACRPLVGERELEAVADSTIERLAAVAAEGDVNRVSGEEVTASTVL